MPPVLRNIAVRHRPRGSDPYALSLDSSGNLMLDPVAADMEAMFAALYTYAVDTLASPRGIWACEEHLHLWYRFRETRDSSHEQRIAYFIPIFIRRIQARSPLLVFDETLSAWTSGSLSRTTWTGPHPAFEPRQFILAINAWHMNAVMSSRDRAVQQPGPDTMFTFHLQCFKVVGIVCHELGHLFATFIAHGTASTPPHMRSEYSRPSIDSSRGESGEHFEQYLFGGHLRYHRDHEPYGHLGFPYVATDRLTEYRALVPSVEAFMTGRMPSRHETAIQWSNQPRSQYARSPLSTNTKPPDTGMPPRTQIEVPHSFSLERGIDYMHDRLRQMIIDPRQK